MINPRPHKNLPRIKIFPPRPRTIHEHFNKIKSNITKAKCDRYIYVGCGANWLNRQAKKAGIGVINPPQNNGPTAPPNANTTGLCDSNDGLYADGVSKRMDEALGAAFDAAKSLCGKDCCCESITVRVKFLIGTMSTLRTALEDGDIDQNEYQKIKKYKSIKYKFPCKEIPKAVAVE